MAISPLTHLLRVSAVLGVAVLSAVAALAVRLGVESRLSHDRGRFVVAHVREHQAAVERGAQIIEARLEKSASQDTRQRAEATHRIIGDLPHDQLLSEGRRMHAEAAGYRLIDRQYDAVALYLASIRSLIQYIEMNSTRSEIPEALFLLGEGLARIRSFYPVYLRSDSILSLCMELYPDSVWASRARMLWNEEYGRGKPRAAEEI